uniref:Uncharacterized protein n=1 Tax=Panagrolaimus superbus TaxID=310955 RepID=A0A914YIE3_9BILA
MGFDYVWVQPTIFDNFYHDDADIPRVSLLGMNGPLQQSIFDVNGSRVSPEIYGMDVAALYNLYSFLTPKSIIDIRDQDEYPYDDIYDDSYLTTYKSFNIIPNPNNTYFEEPAGFKASSTDLNNSTFRFAKKTPSDSDA